MGKATARLDVLCLAFFLLLTLAAAEKERVKATALFAFGDSYADTGNRNMNASSWHKPYGMTWPGHPTGRFSNGHIQTDFIADVVGLPTPTPYALAGVNNISSGIDFALGGSGVTFAYGVPPLGNQIDNFELVVKTGAYSPSFLASSVAFVSNVGNDYNAVAYTVEEFVVVIGEVVEGVALLLQRLYNLGLRNFLVANLPPINCTPVQTSLSNYTACVAALVPLILLHNSRLGEAVAKLNRLPNANYIILDEYLAFQHVLNHTGHYGIKEKFAPCCRPVGPENYCGDVDQQGKPLYMVCDDPTSYTFWDGVHPTESTWNHVVRLFSKKTGFVLGAPTLELWLHENSLRPVALAPSGLATLQGAVQELETAYDTLIEETDYSEAVGLLQAINLDEYLANYTKQEVTIFLPNNEAFYLPLATIGQIYGQNDLIPLISFHAVQGYYNSSQLTNAVRNYTTVSNLQLLVNSTSSAVLIGPEAAKVVRPDLYHVAGEVVIHGIDKILFPPGLQQ